MELELIRSSRSENVMQERLISRWCMPRSHSERAGNFFFEVIRKVTKQHAVLSVDEPVSQLHKCALEMRDTPQAYLAVANDAVVLHQVVAGLAFLFTSFVSNIYSATLSL